MIYKTSNTTKTQVTFDIAGRMGYKFFWFVIVTGYLTCKWIFLLRQDIDNFTAVCKLMQTANFKHSVQKIVIVPIPLTFLECQVHI